MTQKRIIRFFRGVLIALLLFACTVEILGRLYMALHFDTSLIRPSQVIYAYYPELKPILPVHLAPDDGVFDVLLLGGSVFMMRDNHIPNLLSVRLQEEIDQVVRVHNVSASGHTSLDSLNKYRQLEGKHFDCVVFYHNINEIRANNAPDFIFKEDYAQYAFYDEVQTIVSHNKMDYYVTPFLIELFLHRIQRRMGLRESFPFLPEEDWLQYGENLKTEASFRNNITEIADLAQARGDHLMLLKYAYHIPDNYTLEAFENDALDYAIPPKAPNITTRVAIEEWGRVPNVKAALALHNSIIDQIAWNTPKVCYLDQHGPMLGKGHLFVDVCHPSIEATPDFVERMVIRMLECSGGKHTASTAAIDAATPKDTGIE